MRIMLCLVCTLALDAAYAQETAPPAPAAVRPVARAPAHPRAQHQAAALTGRILDPHTMEPVSGVEVAAADRFAGIIEWGQRLSVRAQRRQVRRGPRQSVHAGTAVTDDAGRFSIAGLARGSYTLAARHAAGVAIVAQFDFRAGSAEAEIILEQPVTIAAQFRDAPGQSLVRQLWLSTEAVGLPRNVHFPPWVRLDVRNELNVGPLPLADRWSIVGRKFVGTHRYNAVLLNATAAPDAHGVIRLDINLAAGHALSGIVRGPQGEGLAGVSLVATPGDRQGPALGAVTDAHGRYTVRGLAAGQYTLAAMRHGLRATPG